MDDGSSVKGGGLTLCTDNFSEEEVQLLKTVLEKKFNFTCSIHKKKATNKNSTLSNENNTNDDFKDLTNEKEVRRIYYRIYIFGKDSPLLYSLVHDFMCPDMLYKIEFEIKPIRTLSNKLKNIKAREETIRIRNWKKEHGADSTPPKKAERVLSLSPRAIKARAQRKLLKQTSLKLNTIKESHDDKNNK